MILISSTWRTVACWSVCFLSAMNGFHQYISQIYPSTCSSKWSRDCSRTGWNPAFSKLMIKLVVAPPSHKTLRPIDGDVPEFTLISCSRQLSDLESFDFSITVAAWNVIPSTLAWWNDSSWYLSQALPTAQFFRCVQSIDQCPPFEHDQHALFNLSNSTFPWGVFSASALQFAVVWVLLPCTTHLGHLTLHFFVPHRSLGGRCILI